MNIDELALLQSCSNDATVRSLVQQCVASDIPVIHSIQCVGVAKQSTFRGKTWIPRKAVILGPLLCIYNNYDKRCKGYLVLRGAAMRKVSENLTWIGGLLSSLPIDKLGGFTLQIPCSDFRTKLEAVSVDIDDASKYRKMHSDLQQSSHAIIHQKNMMLKEANADIQSLQETIKELQQN
eukprot:TRINITY_DN4604_c0_g1_i1.p1 TRINITY_DN4604_c0_g1~~TRINITY_DN4604_c0_g1_i1.p1  ORF type:complete len:179 (+),score=37.27 TRINITY_DN4604_c0_g1_i1:63-599(+)